MGNCLGVIGDPIEHSLSPIMHQYWLHENNLPYSYHSFHVKAFALQDALNGIRALGLKGINVTIPHKVTILPYLDEIDKEAHMIGAVNTVVHEDGRLKGYNTDGLGFLSALKEWIGAEAVNSLSHILIIGAGGAARAVALSLIKHVSCDITISNRTMKKANELSQACQKWGQSKSVALEMIQQRLGDFDMIINTTPIGMYPNDNEVPISLQGVKQGTYCVDLIYRPLMTKWLTQAEALGCKTMNGMGMLVNQGALAFQHWFNQWPDTKKMGIHLTHYLEENDVK